MTFHDDNDDVHSDGDIDNHNDYGVSFCCSSCSLCYTGCFVLVPTFEQGLRLQIALGLESL